MEPKDDYVFVTINTVKEGKHFQINLEKTSVTVDEAIEFLQKYKADQTLPMI